MEKFDKDTEAKQNELNALKAAKASDLAHLQDLAKMVRAAGDGVTGVRASGETVLVKSRVNRQGSLLMAMTESAVTALMLEWFCCKHIFIFCDRVFVVQATLELCSALPPLAEIADEIGPETFLEF